MMRVSIFNSNAVFFLSVFTVATTNGIAGYQEDESRKGPLNPAYSYGEIKPGLTAISEVGNESSSTNQLQNDRFKNPDRAAAQTQPRPFPVRTISYGSDEPASVCGSRMGSTPGLPNSSDVFAEMATEEGCYDENEKHDSQDNPISADAIKLPDKRPFEYDNEKSAEENQARLMRQESEEAEKRKKEAAKGVLEKEQKRQVLTEKREQTIQSIEASFAKCRQAEQKLTNAQLDQATRQNMMNTWSCECNHAFPTIYSRGTSFYDSCPSPSKLDNEGNLVGAVNGEPRVNQQSMLDKINSSLGSTQIAQLFQSKEFWQLASVVGLTAAQAYFANQQAENLASNGLPVAAVPEPGPNVAGIAPNLPYANSAIPDFDELAKDGETAGGTADPYEKYRNGEALIDNRFGTGGKFADGVKNLAGLNRFGRNDAKAGIKVSPKVSGGTGGGSSPPSASRGGGGGNDGGPGLGNTVGATFASSGSTNSDTLFGGSLFGAPKGAGLGDSGDDMLNKLFGGDGGSPKELADANGFTQFPLNGSTPAWNPARKMASTHSSIKPMAVLPLFKNVSRKIIELVNNDFQVKEAAPVTDET